MGVMSVCPSASLSELLHCIAQSLSLVYIPRAALWDEACDKDFASNARVETIHGAYRCPVLRAILLSCIRDESAFSEVSAL